MTEAIVDYTITMPGFTLQHGQVPATGGTFNIVFDPVALNKDFPNLDLSGRDDRSSGLSDTISIGMFLTGRRGSETSYSAENITLQGNDVVVGLPGAVTPVISGNAGIGGAILSYTDGNALVASTDGSGSYSFAVSNNWTGTVTPSKLGYTFAPVNRSYTAVNGNQSNQDYTAVFNPPVAFPAQSITPTGFTAVWGTVNGAAGCRLDVAVNIGFAGFVPGYQNRDVGASTTVPVAPPVVDIPYYYRVRAYNSASTSGNSNAVLVRPFGSAKYTYLPLVLK